MTITINELDWKPHPIGIGGERALVTFGNGRGASVLRGGPFYTDNNTYEIAVLDTNRALDYSTYITDDVLGYLTEEEANHVLKQIEDLS